MSSKMGLLLNIIDQVACLFSTILITPLDFTFLLIFYENVLISKLEIFRFFGLLFEHLILETFQMRKEEGKKREKKKNKNKKE